MTKKILLTLLVALSLSACGPKKDITFSEDDFGPTPTPYVDQFANTPINFDKTLSLNQEFEIRYRTFPGNGQGQASFKVRSVKDIPQAGQRFAEDGQKLVLVEISVRGNTSNSGNPSSFNQVGETPSPQFVLIDKANNKSFVEDTYYSDGYTQSKNLFELSKITLDHDKWVNTAIVFAIPSSLEADLAFRWVDTDGNTKFYDIK